MFHSAIITTAGVLVESDWLQTFDAAAQWATEQFSPATREAYVYSVDSVDGTVATFEYNFQAQDWSYVNAYTPQEDRSIVMKRYTVLVGFKNSNELSNFLASTTDITPTSHVDSTCVIYSFKHPDVAFEFVSLITLIGYNYNTLCCNTVTL